MANISKSNEDPYPRKYRATLWGGVHQIGALIFFFLFTLAGRTHGSMMSWPWLVYIGGGFLAFFAANYAFSGITLYADKIEGRTLLGGTQMMLRRDILGIRLFGQLKTPTLISKNEGGADFQLPTGVKKDVLWNDWMSNIPDLDIQDEKAILNDSQTYPELGKTDAERQRRWKTTNFLASTCLVACFVGMLCSFHATTEFMGIAILAIAPWVALANMKLYGIHFSGLPKKTPEIKNIITLFFAPLLLSAFVFQYGYTTSLLSHFVYSSEEAEHILHYIIAPLCGLPLCIVTSRLVLSMPQAQDTTNTYCVMFLLVPALFFLDWGYGIGLATEIDKVLFRFTAAV